MPSKKVTYPISFRADGALLTHLEKGAAAYGISVHEYARQRLTELFERQDEARLLVEGEATRKSVEGLRDDLVKSVEIILLNLHKEQDPKKVNAWNDTVRDWVDSNLRQDSQ